MQKVNICLREYKITIEDETGKIGIVEVDGLQDFISKKKQIESQPDIYKINYSR